MRRRIGEWWLVIWKFLFGVLERVGWRGKGANGWPEAGLKGGIDGQGRRRGDVKMAGSVAEEMEFY